MQKLDLFVPIVTPHDFYVSNVTMTKAGIKKLSDYLDSFYVKDWNYNLESAIDDVESEAVSMESEPVFFVSARRSITGNDEVFRFVRDIDFTVEMRSFQAFHLEQIADELNKLHEVFEAELDRIGA
jgi:hypothetical protein